MKEESQHAILDELEWRAEHERLTDAERDRAVDDLIALVGAVDALLTAQSGADAEYFMKHAGRRFDDEQQERIGKLVLEAYRWQYIVSGVRDPRFLEILADLTTEAQRERIGSALSPLM